VRAPRRVQPITREGLIGPLRAGRHGSYLRGDRLARRRGLTMLTVTSVIAGRWMRMILLPARYGFARSASPRRCRGAGVTGFPAAMNYHLLVAGPAVQVSERYWREESLL